MSTPFPMCSFPCAASFGLCHYLNDIDFEPGFSHFRSVFLQEGLDHKVRRHFCNRRIDDALKLFFKASFKPPSFEASFCALAFGYIEIHLHPLWSVYNESSV
ncbi:MAG: hypothetical protein II008_01735, partial [Oscillospiraceae bacterium]|nr:hypothetical protein [Oscillospiraceae bacterium]